MGKHRRTQHYRRIVIAAVTIGAVGVPSVALACSTWPYGPDDPSQAAVATAPPQQWQHPHRHHHHHHRNGHHTGTPSAAAPHTPRATAHPSATTKAATPRPATPPAPHTTPAASTAPAAPSTPKATPSTPKATPSTPQAPATASGVVARIVQLVNAERSKAGCRPLTLNTALTKAAQDHSADMAAHQTMSHTGSDGSAPGDRITAAGYDWSAYGENVAYGYSTADEVMAGWMSSPGHRANILNCSFQQIGVGLAQPGSYWTQDFGTAR
ncbi:CAP domain-containing protein [Streptomyces sp. NPDC049099]|uniref:CAP domain-containing protein n=1 Tax=Streptomyces sp. NPDC049099 TaxID=3155768 RepID=UPI0034464E5F